MRLFTASAIEIAVLALGMLLLLAWANHIKSTLQRLAEQAQPQRPADAPPDSTFESVLEPVELEPME